MKVAIVAAMLAIAAAGCTQAQKLKAKHDAESRITAFLKDPDSARFSEEFTFDPTGSSPHSCGAVNAKNSFGGYTGMQAYIIWQDSAYASSSEAESRALVACCGTISEAKKAGIPVWDVATFGSTCGELSKLSSGLPFTFSES